MSLKKFLIRIPLLFLFLGASYFVVNNSFNENYALENIPEHKKKFLFHEHADHFGKPRSNIKIKSDPIEKTLFGNFILRGAIKLNHENIDQLSYKWILPEGVAVISGLTEGVLTNEESRSVEIELALENEDDAQNVYLEVFYFDNGFKIGNTKGFSINEKIAPEFKNAKQFIKETRKSNQKIFQ